MMKTTPKRSRAAFTLIELLVVIAIIALLAGVAIPVASIVINRARVVQAKTAMNALAIGIANYRTEYNRFPDVSGSGTPAESPITLGPGNALLTILHPDQAVPSPAANPKRTDFFSPNLAKGNAGGFTPDGALNDPWGHPYRVVMDFDSDGRVADPTGSGTLRLDVIAWSTGKPVNPPNENTDPAQFICNWK